MSNESSNEECEDSAITTVRELSEQGNLIPALLLCSAFVEHYCKTRLFIFLMEHRPPELIEVNDKVTKKKKKVFIHSKLEKIISDMNQRRVIDVGLLVGAWDDRLSKELTKFNADRNDFVHQHEYILKILKKEDEKEVKRIIEKGLALLHNIKLGYEERR
jgi:hypothetical protein